MVGNEDIVHRIYFDLFVRLTDLTGLTAFWDIRTPSAESHCPEPDVWTDSRTSRHVLVELAQLAE
jgi:hypothetical protein